MKKVLLSLAAVGATMSANAQLLNYGFETSDILPGQVVSENWSDEKFQNCTFELNQEGSGINGSNSLWVNTDVTANPWERVIAFTNTGVAENKSYRISLWVKGEGEFNVALLKGCFNHDLALQGGNGSSYVDQTKAFTAKDAGEFVRFSYVVWSPSRDVMSAKKSDFKDDEYWNQDFLRLSFTGVGSYTVDDVKIEESTVQNIAFNEDVIRVDFGYQTNAADLEKAAGTAVVLDKSIVTVKVDGEPVEVSSVEIKDGGKFYIFLEAPLAQDAVVSVSFTNPGDLKYSTNVAPESWTNPNAAVYNFEDEAAYFDGELVATSVEWEEATLVSANPDNDSFEWTGDINTFSFTFNKAVWTNDDENGAPTALLTGPGLGAGEELAVVANENADNTITFKRTGSEPLADGMYSISVDNVSNVNHIATTTPFSITFEVGLVEMGDIKYTDYSSIWMEGEYNTAQPTNGWISYFNGEENSSNANRVGNFITDGKGVGFYFCQRDGSVAAKLTLGEKEDAPFTLPEANVQITFFSSKWQGAGGTYSYKLVKKDNPEEVVASGDIASESNLGGFGEAAASISGAAVKIPNMVAGDYILTLETAAAWSGTIFFGIDVKTYKEEGPSVNPAIIINESFASVENGKVPAAGTGWAVYDNNNLGAKGQSQSGRNRMMSTGSCTNLSIGFYNRCFGEATAYYMTYGEPAPDGQEEPEPELILENAKYSFSWYAVNWKGAKQTYYFQLINAETNEVEYEMTPVEVTASVEGGAQSAEAVQIQFNYVPQGGKYIMKWWMTGEAIIGKIRVEKMGSLAVFWKNKLINDGLEIAKAERENANAEEYAGTTRDNLDAAIAKNTNPSANGYHTPADYQAGIDECLAAAKAMAARRDAIAKFKTDIVKLADALAAIDAKFEKLEIIPQYKELVAQYAEVDPSTLEDEVLLPVQAKITTGVTAVKDVIDAVSNLITKQIQNLLAGISVYGSKLDDEFSLALISQGEQTLTDDQNVANALQQLLTGCIYDSIANGYNFTTYDAESDLSFPDSIDITGYIANDMFYTVNSQKNYMGPEANATFPGWNITEGQVSNVWWWENALVINENKPAVNASLRNVGSNAFKVNQELKNVPAGVYTMVMKTADCSNVADVSQTYTKKDETLPWSTSEVYAQVGEAVTSVEANYGSGQVWRNASDTYLPNIQGTVAAGENTVAMTIGANMNCTNDAAQVDDTKLYMTAKIEGFDYRAAADAILNNLKTGVKAVERTDAPVAVRYYNLAGQTSAAQQGVNIKVERYSDGYTVVRKVIVK